MTGRGARVKPTHTIESIVTSDASRPDDIQQSMHFACIKDVLFTESKPEVYEFSLARCRAFAERKIPAVSVADRTQPQPLLVQFLNGLWPAARAADIASLFHAYVAAGLIDVNATVAKPYATGSVQIPPLEAAVRSYRNLNAMVALIEAGADETRVPSTRFQMKGAFRVEDDGPVLAEVGDFLSFTKNQTERGPEFFAAAKAAIMRRVISTSVSESQSDGPAPAARQRRSPGV